MDGSLNSPWIFGRLVPQISRQGGHDGPGPFSDDFKGDAVAQITERGYPVAGREEFPKLWERIHYRDEMPSNCEQLHCNELAVMNDWLADGRAPNCRESVRS